MHFNFLSNWDILKNNKNNKIMTIKTKKIKIKILN